MNNADWEFLKQKVDEQNKKVNTAIAEYFKNNLRPPIRQNPLFKGGYGEYKNIRFLE